jgi:signal transduction histidine kinase
LIEALLTLASSEGGLNEREPVGLALVVGRAVVGLQPEIDGRLVHVHMVTAPAPIDGDALLVERLVANLLTNAIRHNVVDGYVEIATRREGGTSVLSGRTVGQSSRLPSSTVCSSPFNVSTRAATTTTDTAWGSLSCEPSRPPTVAPFPPNHWLAA